MAQINKQSVMQKLIDELQLFPAQDVIPTQLAEKIVPTFQVNTEEITVSPIPANVVRSNVASGVATTTIYAVPATGKFYLTNIALVSMHNDLGVARSGVATINITIDGSVQQFRVIQMCGANSLGKSSEICLNFQNPILIDASTNIEVQENGVGMQAIASIVGYYQAP